MANLLELPEEEKKAIFGAFQNDFNTAEETLNARMKDIRPHMGETIETVREEVLGPVMAKWGTLFGRSGGNGRAPVDPTLARWQTVTRPDGSMIRVNSATGEAAPFDEGQAQTAQPGKGFFYAGSAEGLPIARDRFSAGLPPMIGSSVSPGPLAEAGPLTDVRAGPMGMNDLGLPPEQASLTGPMAKPLAEQMSPRIEELTYGTNKFPIMVNPSGAGRLLTLPQTKDNTSILVNDALSRRRQAERNLTSLMEGTRSKAQDLVSKANDDLKRLGIEVDTGTAIEEAPRDPSKLRANTVYQTPKGPLRWTGRGFVKP